MTRWYLNKASFITQIILLGLFACTSATAINQLDSQYQQWEQEMNASPNKVIKALNESFENAEKNKLSLAQHHFLYSETYISITYPDKALEHAELALSAVDKNEQPWLYNKILVAKVIALDYSGKPQQALPLIHQVINWASQNNAHWLMVEALSARGYLYIAMSLSVEALNDFQKAYEMVPEKGGEINKGDISIDIALVYENRSENELAIPFFQQSVDYHRQEKNYLELSIALYGLGRANKNIGEIELGKNQLEESARLAKKVNDFQGEAYALKELAGLADQAGHTDQAIEILEKAYKTFEKSNNKFMLLDTSYSLSRIYLTQNKIDLAEEYLTLAKTYLDPVAMPTQNISVEELSAKILAFKGEFKAAYILLAATVIKKQHVFTETSINKLNQYRTQYDLANKEKENSILLQKNEMQAHRLEDQTERSQLINWLFFAFFLAFLLLVYIAYRSRKNRLRFQYLAEHDAMTGMNNRSHCLGRMKQLIHVSDQQSLLLAMLDLDHFKNINDHFGHAVGDQVLIQFSQLCLKHFDSNVILGRFGGEEFLLAMPYGDQHQLKRSLEQLKRTVYEEIQIEFDPNVRVSFSAGISRCRGVEDLDKAIHRADMAMYKAKAKGRDQIILHREINQ